MVHERIASAAVWMLFIWHAQRVPNLQRGLSGAVLVVVLLVPVELRRCG